MGPPCRTVHLWKLRRVALPAKGAIMRRSCVTAAILALAAIWSPTSASPASGHEFDYVADCETLTPRDCAELRASGKLVQHCYRQWYAEPINEEGIQCGPREDTGYTTWQSYTTAPNGVGRGGGYGYWLSVQPASGAKDGRTYDIVLITYTWPDGALANVTYHCFPNGRCDETGRRGVLPFER
jgi:hypothetical protein